MSTDDRPVVVAVVGPTATGKSDLGLRLADELGGEVVGADASQLYRGMDIGTAKLSVVERRGIPHHQVDVLEVTEEASVAGYQRPARADVDAIRARGAPPGPRGGVRPLRAGAARPPRHPPDRPRRASPPRGAAEEVGTRVAHAELRELDPQAAAAVEPNNRRRIVRALEVIELTGRPFSATMPRREFVHPPSSSGSCRPATCSTPGSSSACTGCGPPDSSTRSAAWRRTASGRGARRARRSATRRRWPSSTGSSTRRRRRSRPSRRRAASRVARSRGSGRTPHHVGGPQRAGCREAAVAGVRAAVGDNGRHG